MVRHNHLIDRYYLLSSFCKISGDRKSKELQLSTCTQLRMTEHPSRKVMNFRHLLGCDTIGKQNMPLNKICPILNLNIEAVNISVRKMLASFNSTKVYKSLLYLTQWHAKDF